MFESQHRILDRHFLSYICCKNCNDVCLKRPKINNKRGRGWPIFFKKAGFIFNMFDQYTGQYLCSYPSTKELLSYLGSQLVVR